MKKRCRNCNRILEDRPDFDLEEVVCPDCGGELVVEEEPVSPQQMPQIDNRMEVNHGNKTTIGEVRNGNETHIGTLRNSNDTNVGGDNAESIDKSTNISNTTTNTTSNTTYNNTTIVQAKDEGNERVKCEYTGRNVRLSETFTCRICKRLIWDKYYVEPPYNCCSDCRDKLIAKRQLVAGIGGSSSTPTVQPNTGTNYQPAVPKASTISVNPNQSHVPYSDTSRAGSSTNKAKYILIGALLVAGYVGYNIVIHSDDDKAGLVAEQVEQPAEAAPAQESAEKKAASASTAGSKSNTTAAAPATASQSGQKTAEVKKAGDSAKPVAAAPATSSATSAAPAASASNTASAATEQPAEKRELSAAELLSQGLSATKRFKPEQAVTYFQQAIAKGSVEANYYLGELYYNGNGVAKSFPTAKSYFEKAANAGMADAQYMMGVMARNGQGGNKDINAARSWFQKAAAQGHAKAGQMLR